MPLVGRYTTDFSVDYAAISIVARKYRRCPHRNPKNVGIPRFFMICDRAGQFLDHAPMRMHAHNAASCLNGNCKDKRPRKSYTVCEKATDRFGGLHTKDRIMAKRAEKISLQGRKGAAGRAKRSRSEYAADQRERDAFLDRMKITDPAMRELYGRARSSHVDLARLLNVAGPEERLTLIQAMIKEKGRSIDRMAHLLVPERTSLRSAMRIDSKATEDVFADRDHVLQTLFVLCLMREEIAAQDAEIMRIENEYLAHLASLTEHESKAIRALDLGPAALARVLELYGHLKTINGPDAAALVKDLDEFLEQRGHGRPVDLLVRDRLLERLEVSLGTEPDHTEIELSGVDPDVEESTIGEHRDDLSVSSCYPNQDAGVGDQNLSVSAGDCSEKAHQPIQDAPQQSEEESINQMVDSCLAGVNEAEPRFGGEAHPELEPVEIVSVEERADDETASSSLRDDAVECSATPPLFGTIAGDLETLGETPLRLPVDEPALGLPPADDAVGFPETERATWFESDFAPGSVSPWRPAILARIDEREPASDHLKLIVDGGMVDADIWLKPDLAESGLRLVQRTGRSSLLPPYNAVFLPPKLTMLGLAGTVSIDPAESNRLDCWDRQSIQNNTFGEFGQGAIASTEDVEDLVRKAIAQSIETERIFTRNILIDERQLAMMTRYWILLLLALNRPNLISVFGMSYFLGVHGHDPGLGDEGYFEIIQ